MTPHLSRCRRRHDRRRSRRRKPRRAKGPRRPSVPPLPAPTDADTPAAARCGTHVTALTSRHPRPRVTSPPAVSRNATDEITCHRGSGDVACTSLSVENLQKITEETAPLHADCRAMKPTLIAHWSNIKHVRRRSQLGDTSLPGNIYKSMSRAARLHYSCTDTHLRPARCGIESLTRRPVTGQRQARNIAAGRGAVSGKTAPIS